MMLCLLRILVGHVQTHMVDTVYLHLLVDGTRHDVAGSETQPLVVFLHERLSVGQSQDAAVASHRLCDEVCGMGLLRIIQ